MNYSVKDVLSLPIMKEAALVTGEKSITARVTESIAVIEIPVEDFVRENELILSTGIGCGSNPSLFLSFVGEVYSAGAAALAIAVGRHVQEIPEDVIQFANEKNFPLIELPWEIRFSDIIKTVLEEIHQWQKDELQKTDQIQRKLLQYFLENKTIYDALNFLGKKFSAHAFIIKQDSDFILTSSPEKLIGSRHFYFEHSSPAVLYNENGSLVQLTPIQLTNWEAGMFVLELEAPASPPISWTILNQAVSALNLWLQKEQSKLDNALKEKEELIQQLIKNERHSKSELETAAASLEIDIALPYVCIIGHLETDGFDRVPNPLSRKVENLLYSCADKLKKKIICAFTRDKLIIFLEASREEANRSAHQFLDEFEPKIKAIENAEFSWGIGENHAGTYSFHTSYKDALIALEIGRNHKGPGTRSTYANTGVFRMLSVLAKDSNAAEMMHKTIGAIAAYDKERGLDLLHTLASYLQNQGNVSQTSRILSLHRQSLLYRLNKIEALSGRSLGNPDDLFLLQLCLKLWTIRFEAI
ncbi:PucR family transcriptional regulator ligand-binding domain-containing protein [Bacillus gobiensis]|uniref:PucR family transcriptional regulator n=1 Tax=Bacillus gobiensis TaxID=1441095 RepID=UPI003D21DA8B